jgi:hypothetical protein
MRGIVQGADLPDKLHKDILRQIFSGGPIAQYAQPQTVDHALVFPYQRGHSLTITGSRRRPLGVARL